MSKKPLTGKASAAGRSIVRLAQWRERYNPLRGLTFTRAIALVEAYRAGEFADLQWTYSHLEESDPELFAIADRRLSSIVEMDWNIKAIPEHRRTKSFDDKLADDQKAALRETYDRLDNLYEAISHLALATFRGFAHLEKHTDGDSITHLEPVDQWNVVRDGFKGPWKYNPDATNASFRSLPDANLMPDDQFITRVVRRHVDRVALFKAIRTSLGEKDWTAFIEIYGIPGGVVVMPPNIPQGKEDDFESSAVAIAEGGSGALPHGADYKPNDTPRGTNPFTDYLDYFSRQLVLVGTGGLLTMLAQSGSGTLAGSAHMEAFRKLAKAEGRQISEEFQQHLDTHQLNLLFPGRPHLAYFDLDTQTETSTSEIINHITQLSAAGYRLPSDHVQEKTGYTIELLQAPPQPDPLDQSDPSDPSDPSAQPAQPAPAVDGAPIADDVSATALNGAQVQALIELAKAVANGELPLDSGLAIAFASFPNAPSETINKIFATLARFKPAVAPGPAPFPNRTQPPTAAIDTMYSVRAGTFTPLLDRIDALLLIEDPAQLRDTLDQLLAEIPTLAQDILGHPEYAELLAALMTTAGARGIIQE